MTCIGACTSRLALIIYIIEIVITLISRCCWSILVPHSGNTQLYLYFIYLIIDSHCIYRIRRCKNILVWFIYSGIDHSFCNCINDFSCRLTRLTSPRFDSATSSQRNEITNSSHKYVYVLRLEVLVQFVWQVFVLILLKLAWLHVFFLGMNVKYKCTCEFCSWPSSHFARNNSQIMAQVTLWCT